MVILLDAAPSNDEMLGFFIVFGLFAFIFVVAKLFGPHDGAAPALAQSDEGGSSAMSKIVVGFVIIGVIFWIIASIGSTPH